MTRYAIAVLIAALPLAAQTTSVQGLVTDSQGAAIPEAVVTARNLDTSAERKTPSCSREVCSLPVIEGRRLITSTVGTTPPGVATTTEWPASTSRFRLCKSRGGGSASLLRVYARLGPWRRPFPSSLRAPFLLE